MKRDAWILVAGLMLGATWSLAQTTTEPTIEQKIAELNARILAEPRNGAHYNDLGVLYTEQENWVLARDAFIRAVQAKRDEADYHRNLGFVFLKLEDYELAASEFEAYKALGMTGDNDGYRLIARARELGGDPAAALAALDEGLAALGNRPDPEVMRLALAKARILNDGDDESRLTEHLEAYLPAARELRAGAEPDAEGVAEAQALETNLVVMQLENGRILEDSGLAAEAAGLYAKVHALVPERDDILPRLVDAHIAAGDLVQAKAAAEIARQDHPGNAGTWIATGKIAEREVRLEAAVEAYERALELAPATPGLGTVIGNLYLKLGRTEKAREYLAESIEDPDTPPEVVYNYAVGLIREKKYQAALAPLQRVTREQPGFAPAWSALAQCLRAQDRYASAIAPYRRALDLAPDAKLAYNLGICAMRADSTAAAVGAFETAIALDPQFSEARYNLGLALMKAERLEEALVALDAALVADADRYRILLNQGVILYRLGRHEDAIAKYNLALEQQETAEAYDNMGLAYQALGNKERAQMLYREAKKLRGER